MRTALLRAVSAAVMACACTTTNAAPSLQQANDQGKSLGLDNKNSVGTSRINVQTASQVPFYKTNPTQGSAFQGGFGDMVNTGVSRITQSKGYSAGSCDREGFNPATEAEKSAGPEKWAKMSSSERMQAIKDQSTYFDQECEGINFLAGDYQMRQKVEISPGDDLNKWNPGGSPDGIGQCITQTVTVPPEYEKFVCNETTALEHRQCFDTSNVNVYYKDGLPDPPVTYILRNENSPTWNLTVWPSRGVIDVYAPNAILGSVYSSCAYKYEIGQHCTWWSGGDSDTCLRWEPDYQCYPGYVENIGPASETISMYGGQTSISQHFYQSEYFRIRSRPRDTGCTFAVDNWHYAGGAGPGPEDNHITWVYNFCQPIKHVDVTWNNNCSLLDAAVNR